MSKNFYFKNSTQAPTFVLNKRNLAPSPESTVEPLAVSSREAAKMLGISEASLYRLVKEGTVNPSRLGRSVRYPLKELQACLERNKVNPK